MDEINAPPASSASEDEGNAWPDIHSLAKRRRRPSVSTPLRDDNLSDISSPPSLTHSPNYADKRSGRSRGRAAAESHELAAMTSADLANLLPKRRYRKTREDGEETDPGEEADDDDEEEEEEGPSHPRTRSRSTRRGGSRTPSRAASRATPTSGRQRGNNALAPRQTPVSKRRTRSATSKTYSRRSSDKENQSDDEADDSQFQPLDDETFDATSAIDFQSVDELKTATKKFMEVDKWELEYEEVAESFSPKGAR
jgi:ATP-dependent RNA helicase MRH4